MAEELTLTRHQQRQADKADRVAENKRKLKASEGTVKVKVLTALAGKRCYNPGATIEVPDFEAERLIEAGAVERIAKGTKKA